MTPAPPVLSAKVRQTVATRTRAVIGIAVRGALREYLHAPARQRRLERAVFGLNGGWDSQIEDILIQPVGWAEASRNAQAVFARLARPGD